MPNYREKVNFSSTDNCGSVAEGEDDVYTVDEFKANALCGAFTDYDGYGCPVRNSLADPNIWLKPSRLEAIPEDATHIVWYNK